MRVLMLSAAMLPFPALAWADGFEQCEIVIMEDIADEDGGNMAIASFRPADTFLGSVRDPEADLVLTDGGYAIRALMCMRNDLIPTESDYAVLATGVPLAISQDFDSTETDSLTIYFDDDAFRHKYASAYPMSDEFSELLTARLDDFSSRDHGLPKPAAAIEGDSEADQEAQVASSKDE